MIRTETLMNNQRPGIFSPIQKATEKGRRWIWITSYQWGIFQIAMGILLGRALILQELSPFAIPYFIVMYFLRRNRLFLIFLGLTIGSATQSWGIAGGNFAGMALALIALKVLERKRKLELNHSPVLVFLAVLLSRSAIDYVSGQMTGYNLLMNGVEGILAMILTFIFIQSIPIITSRRIHNQWRSEEIICLIILLASILTGTVGWSIKDVSIENILSRYLVLLFAAVGGGTIGASVGIITGMVLSLSNLTSVYQISLLGFSGLLGGLLKEGRRWSVAFGFLVGSSILTVYAGEQREMIQSFIETAIAVVLFLITPRKLKGEIAKYIPGTSENSENHHQYLRHMRDLTVTKMDQFSNLFLKLSESFLFNDNEEKRKEGGQIEELIHLVSKQSCMRCWKKDQCWERDVDRTYASFSEMINRIQKNGDLAEEDLPVEFRRKCVKQELVRRNINQEHEQWYNQLRLKRQIHESKQLVAAQLAGISRVIHNFSEEINKEGTHHFEQEQQIVFLLEGLGLSIRNIDILNLEEGAVDIEISQPSYYGREECEKIIAPLLSDLLGERIMVKEMDCGEKGGFCKITLGSAPELQVCTGVAGAAKGGQLLSGDCFKIMDIGGGKVALAMSDGMGNGERAYLESSSTLELLQQLLELGLDETLCIKSINTVLSLRSPDEVFATVDLALVDLHSGRTKFIKTGSTPSFIKRGDEVIPISANNLPIGIIDEIDVDVVQYSLQPGDLLIMITDGIYDAALSVENKNLWMKRKISELKTDNPQEIADLLLELVIRQHYGEIKDDMTVMVARMDRYESEWATISIPNAPKIDRPKYVS